MGLVLEAIGLTKSFGGVRALDDVSVSLDDGTVVGIIGANGAGKTTFVNTITGYIRPDRGRVRHRGQDVTGVPPRALARRGIARSFQIPQVYTTLTVLDNALIALASRERASLRPWAPLHTAERERAALEILEPFGLREHARRPVSELPEGGLKFLDIALATALEPALLLLDEPTSGVSSADKFDTMQTLLAALRRRRVTVVFVEHDMDVVTRYAERVLAFVDGRIVADGRARDVLADVGVRKSVLGLA